MTTIDKLNKYECDKEIRHYFFLFLSFRFCSLNWMKSKRLMLLNFSMRHTHTQRQLDTAAANYVQEQNIKHINTY